MKQCLLLFFLLLIYLIGNYLHYSFTTDDSLSYFEIAKKLPSIQNSLFPIGYPSLLKIIAFITNDYILSYKILNIILISLSFYIPFYYNFYWKQIWCILTFTPFLEIYLHAWSEVVLIPLILLFTILNYKFIKEEISPIRFIIITSVILFGMLIIKYNSIFFLLSTIIFSIINKKNRKSYFTLCIISLFLFCVYLFFNYSLTGHAMGARLDPNYSADLFLKKSLTNAFLTLNPLKSFITKNITTEIYTSLLQIISFIFLVFIFIKSLKTKFSLFLILQTIIFVFLTITSGLNTRIDFLDSRLLLGFYLFFYLSFVSIFNNNKKISNILYFFSIASLLLSIIN